MKLNVSLARRSLALLAAVSVLSLFETTAYADGYRDRTAAKKLETEGIKREEAGDCAGALDKLQEAASLVNPTPQTAMHSARCLEKLRKLLVERKNVT